MEAIMGYIDRINYDQYCDHQPFFGSLNQNTNMDLENYFPLPVIIDLNDWIIFPDRVTFRAEPKL